MRPQFPLLATMMSLKHRLLNGGKSYGPMLMSDSPIVAELLALSGYGHIVVDHEHSVTDVRSGQAILQAIQAAQAVAVPGNPTRTEAIVRVPSPKDPAYMKKVLDSLMLPAGVLVPMVDDAATAREVVQSTRYPLQALVQDDAGGGIRGNAWPLARASAYGFNQNYVQQACQDLLVMVQVESLAGVRAIGEIAAVPGVDAIFIGPLDLSTSVGKMGQYQDPDVAQLLHDAEQAVLTSGTLLAGFRPPGRDLKEMFESGYSLIAGSVDLGLLQESARKDIAEANTAMQC